MSIYLKILVVAVCAYLLVGMFFATRFALRYDPAVTSVPNTATTFVFNVVMWPL